MQVQTLHSHFDDMKIASFQFRNTVPFLNTQSDLSIDDVLISDGLMSTISQYSYSLEFGDHKLCSVVGQSDL